jgi:hypothetical protein
MKCVGVFLALLGAGIAILGTLPLLWLLLRDPTEAADHSGMLMTFAWFAGGTLFGVGILMAVYGRRWRHSRAI